MILKIPAPPLYLLPTASQPISQTFAEKDSTQDELFWEHCGINQPDLRLSLHALPCLACLAMHAIENAFLACLATLLRFAIFQMVVGGHPGVGVGLLPDGVRLHNVGDGERPAQHVGAPQPPLQGEQRLAPEEQARIQGNTFGYFR